MIIQYNGKVLTLKDGRQFLPVLLDRKEFKAKVKDCVNVSKDLGELHFFRLRKMDCLKVKANNKFLCWIVPIGTEPKPFKLIIL